MKFSLFKNDKSTTKDEFLLLGFIVLLILAGTVLLITKPAFWVVDQTAVALLGLILVLTGAMFIPGLIYRFLSNDKKTKK